ncbi:hypothetical protein AXG93_4773s1300 [Marchantia polymorpha subsp. ruderalis]|uniref:Uncharacterized protein n=1 Tax=Marchantia polymorpha subsp. ruderalis TaxID=1480154 RepID=A0A176WJ44_MARPO|nr:hypothetical protein AXG93_4773s1300 [Marchantia polymorpha subsp. ruderalis]
MHCKKEMLFFQPLAIGRCRQQISPTVDFPLGSITKASNSGSAWDKPAVARPRFWIPVRSLMSPEQLEVKCVADETWYNADVDILDDGILVRTGNVVPSKKGWSFVLWAFLKTTSTKKKKARRKKR